MVSLDEAVHKGRDHPALTGRHATKSTPLQRTRQGLGAQYRA